MITLIKLAYRDLGRNRRRSFFSSLALGMGLALLLLMASVVNGEMRGSINASIRLQSGHIQVRAKTFSEDKSSLAYEDLVADPAKIAAQIAAFPQVKAATPRLYASGMVSVKNETVGVRVMGIDPGSAANAPFQENLLSGAPLSTDDRSGILIGKALADKLAYKTGDSIDLLVNTSSGSMAEQAFTVRGIYTTGTPAIDQTTILMPLAKAQAISQTENHASLIFITLKDIDQTDRVATALKSSQYQVVTWAKLNEITLQTEQLAKAYMILMYIIVLAITATVIINTLIMSVFERTREIGILSAMGMKAFRIMSMFFTESGLLAVGGIIMGLIIGALLVFYAMKVGFYIGNIGVGAGILVGERIYAYPAWNDIITLTITAFIVTLVAGLYPALLAARMEPVEALHSGD